MKRVTSSKDDLGQLYESGYPRFMRVATAMLGDPERARDAVHDTFVRAVSDLGQFRGDSSLETWVWRILTNACFSEARRAVTLFAEPVEQADRVTEDMPEIRAGGSRLADRQRAVRFLRH